MTYWTVMALTLAALAVGGAAPVKIAVFVAACLLVATLGWRLCGPLVALALVIPEGGGARPAAVPFLTLLLWPLAIRVLQERGWSPLLRLRPIVGLLALGAAGLSAAALGVLVRHAPTGSVLFEVFAPHVHMLAFAVFALAPAAPGLRGTVPEVDRWLLGGALLAGSLGIVQVLGGEVVVDAMLPVTEAVGYASRDFATISQQIWWGVRKAFGAFFSPNGLGAAMAFSLVVAAGHLARPNVTADRPFLWTVACVVWTALLLTFSRAALLAAVFGLALVAIVYRPTLRSASGCLLLVAALALPAAHAALLFESPDVVATTGVPGVAAEIKEQTASMKVEEVRRAVTMFRQGSWFGSGYGVIFEPTRGFVSDDRSIGISPAAAEIVYRSGIVGLIALVVAVITFGPLLRDHWQRTLRSPVSLRGSTSPLLLALTTALALSCIDHPFYTVPGLSIVFWGTWGDLARTGTENHGPR